MTLIIKTIKSIALLEKKIRALEDEKEVLRSKLLSQLREGELENYNFDDDMTSYKATIVRSDKVEIDEKGFLEDLSSEIYDEIVEKKINRKLLEKAIEDGKINKDIAKKNIKVKSSKPYVRLNVTELIKIKNENQ